MVEKLAFNSPIGEINSPYPEIERALRGYSKEELVGIKKFSKVSFNLSIDSTYKSFTKTIPEINDYCLNYCSLFHINK
jgi:hypothetical protein